MIIGDIADGIARGVEGVTSTVSEAFFEPVLRLGVTGLSRSGKTIFITSLVANLMNRARMGGLSAHSEGRIEAAYLQPQPDDTVPRFDFETHLGAMTGPQPHWPDSTRAISELRLSFKVRPSGLLGGLQGPRTLHLDIVDYPGEWLLDLGLLDQSFEEWSAETLKRIEHRPQAEAFLGLLKETDPKARLNEPAAKALADAFTQYLNAAREDGFSDCTPGRFLLPGDLAGSPVLTFAPLSPGGDVRRSLAREFSRRFEAYKREVVKPFFREHFQRIDRQVVLVNALGAIHAGPQAVEDMRLALGGILSTFRPGRNSFLNNLLTGKRVERILVAATKADHLHHTQHPAMTGFAEALLKDALGRAQYAGAKTRAMAIASLRATTEETRTVNGDELAMVRGVLSETGKSAAFYPGDLPIDPGALLTPARQGADAWLSGDYGQMRFDPQPVSLKPGEGPPHIRLDRAAEFLIGDRL